MDRLRISGPGLAKLDAYGMPIETLGLSGPGAGGLASTGLPGPGGGGLGPLGDLGLLSGPGGLGQMGGSLFGMSLGSPSTIGRMSGTPDWLNTPLTWPGREAKKAASTTGQSPEGGGGTGAAASTQQMALPTDNLPGTSANVMRWLPMVKEMAAKYNLPVEAVLAVIHHESGGNERATSKDNPGYGPAKGLMQTLQLHYKAGQDPYDPATNLDAGTRYFASIYHKFGNRLDSAMAGYFGGEGVLNPDGSVRNPGAADVNGTTIGGYVPMYLRTVAAYRNALGQQQPTPPAATAPAGARGVVRGWTNNAPYTITGEFGQSDGPYPGSGHVGMDIGTPSGTPITAAQGGTIVHAGGDYNNGNYGNSVVMRTADNHLVILGHLSQVATQVGAQVAPGAVLGRSGATGRTTGPHLHLEVRDPAGRSINPRTYFQG